MNTSILIQQENELYSVAQHVAHVCPEQCYLALHGALGAGKTTFIKYLGSVWNVSGIKSPSFDIIHVHHGLRTLIHMDAYRLYKNDLSAFDFDDLCVPPFCLAVEWPEHLEEQMNFNMHLHFTIQANGTRKIQLTT